MALAASAALCTGCAVTLLPGYEARANPANTPAAADAAAPLAAQGSYLASPAGDARTWVVFDRAIDPTTLRAFNFVLVYADDSRSYPSAVHLAGADVGTDTRSVVLEGNFVGDDKQWRLVLIQIIGPVYTADGRPLRGTSIAVEAPQPPRPIFARQVDHTKPACPSGMVRVYFSDAVETVQLKSTKAHEPQRGARHQSNRVDLCASASGELHLDPGVVIGPGEHPNLAATVNVEPAP